MIIHTFSLRTQHKLLKIQSACSHRAQEDAYSGHPAAYKSPTVSRLYTNSPQVVFQTSLTLVQFITTNSVLVSCIFLNDFFQNVCRYLSFSHGISSPLCRPSTPASQHSGRANVLSLGCFKALNLVSSPFVVFLGLSFCFQNL